MSTYIADILALIKAKVDTVDALVAVYTNAVDIAKGYPFATIGEAGWSGVFSDTERNRRSFIYEIHLYQEVSENTFNQEKARRVLTELQDEILTAFDNDPTLGGGVLLCQPISGTPPVLVNAPAVACMVIITIQCEKLVTRDY